MSVSLARYLWAHMTGLYGHKWTSAYGDDPVKTAGKEWSLTLEDLSREQIDLGLQACRTSGDEWPPNASLFRAMCLAIPSLEAVRAELHGGEPSPFTRAVWARLDTYRYRHVSTDLADRLLAGAYQLVHEAVMQGKALPAAPVAAIQQEVRKLVPVTADQLAGHVARIKALLAGAAA